MLNNVEQHITFSKTSLQCILNGTTTLIQNEQEKNNIVFSLSKTLGDLCFQRGPVEQEFLKLILPLLIQYQQYEIIPLVKGPLFLHSNYPSPVFTIKSFIDNKLL